MQRGNLCRVYWISPFSWSVRALAVNEMTSPRWQGVTVAQSGATGGAGGAGAGSQTLGDTALAEYGFYRERCASRLCALGARALRLVPQAGRL